MNEYELRNELIKHVEGQRLGGIVDDAGFDLKDSSADFVVELDGVSYQVEIRRLP